MCRNIKTLHHFSPPATVDEVRASALQYVRKLSGMPHPSKANEAVFKMAVEKITQVTMQLFDVLAVHTPPRTRESEKVKALERGKKREAQLRARYASA